MSITQERKAELIKEFGRAEGDTGSPEVQVSILTERIRNLTEHLKEHIFHFFLLGRRRPMRANREAAALLPRFASPCQGVIGHGVNDHRSPCRMAESSPSFRMVAAASRDAEATAG